MKSFILVGHSDPLAADICWEITSPEGLEVLWSESKSRSAPYYWLKAFQKRTCMQI